MPIHPSLNRDASTEALERALGSQYELRRLLGRGGMGAVYLAHESFLERDVAVKVLPSELASGDARERFLREARTAARLSHPNIVPLYTFGQAGDLLYYVMGYVEGEALEARLRREGRLDPEETRRIIRELADALDYAHQMGVVHRDVKPDNVLIDRTTGRPMLTDFGVARQRAASERLTQTGVIVGTPHYMSPEQASGDRDLDGRSDIYSLGVLAYRMATGRLPFEGGSLQEVLSQHATRVPIPPTQIITSIPLDLDTVITRSLAKDPLQRWPRAGTLRDALSGDHEDALPDTLRDNAGITSRLGLSALALTQFAFVGHQFRFMDVPLVLVTLGAAAVLGLTGIIVPAVVARRFGWRATFGQTLRQPAWWTGWWPRLGRRTGDVWDRLPTDVRRLRLVESTAMVVNIVMLNGMMVGMTKVVSSGDGRIINSVVVATLSSLALIFAWMVPEVRRLHKRLGGLGISRVDVRRLLNEHTANSAFWNRPHIAALLRPPETRVRPELSSPADLVRAIRAQAAEEAQSPHAAVYREAATAAVAIGDAIAHVEGEIAILSRDADPKEAERVRASLAALGAADRNETPAKAQMRSLLEKQVELLQDLERRISEANRRRDHLHEQLRTLSLHLAHLRAAGASRDASDITGRIRSVCREIDYRVEGMRQVQHIAG